MTAAALPQPVPPHRRGVRIGRHLAAAGLPVAVALVVGAVVLLLSGHDPVMVYRLIAVEAFGGERRVAATLAAATPLMLTGLATALAFRSGVFNVGVEGCLYVGALAAATVGFEAVALPAAMLLPLSLLAGLLAGAAWMVPPAVLRARLAVDEVVTTLMLNFVAVGLTAYLANGPLLAPGSANSSTPMIAAAARLPRLLSSGTLNGGVLIALAALALYAVWSRTTVLGYETRLTGLNPRFAHASGIEVPRLVVAMMLASGAIGGLAGGVQALGVVHRFVAGFSPGYGFTGIAVALLGRNTALGMALAALLFGALASAGATIQLFSDVPIEIVQVLEGVVMIFAVARLPFASASRRSARP